MELCNLASLQYHVRYFALDPKNVISNLLSCCECSRIDATIKMSQWRLTLKHDAHVKSHYNNPAGRFSSALRNPRSERYLRRG